MKLVPETIVEDGATWIVAVNTNQNLLGKTMLILRRPCTSVVDLEDHEWSALLLETRRVAAALTRLFAPDQFNFAFLMNLDAQVHLHVVPRYSGDRSWRGRTFSDPDWGSAFGDQPRPLPLADLALLAADIRDALPPEPSAVPWSSSTRAAILRRRAHGAAKQEGGNVTLYLTRFSYTPETWARLIGNPEDRRKAAQAYVESVGGKLHGFWYAFGDHDGYTLWEAPDNTSMAAVALAITGGGALSAFDTTVLLTVEETLEALRKAEQIRYRPPGA